MIMCILEKYDNELMFMRKKTTKQFKEQMQVINPDIEIIGEYQGNKIKIACRCKICNHEWEARPDNLLNNHGCPNCKKETIGNLKRYSQDEFILKCKQVHNNKYDYSLVKYTSSLDYIIIICPEHGNFEQRADMHLSGQGCPCCSGKVRKTKEQFINQAQAIHGNKYNYQQVDYHNGYTPVEITCPIHGTFLQRPDDHIFKKCGCPKCSKSHGEEFIETLLSQRNIEFISQYEIEIDSKINKSGKASIDFYLPNSNIFIEYNGKQHYIPQDRFGGKLKFDLYQVPRDKYIKNYCRENNIKLIEIPYTYADSDIINIINSLADE